jgi:RNA-binding protein
MPRLELSSRQRKFLRGLAHAYEPVVHLGKAGLTDAVLAQIDRALADHELIKLRYVDGKEEKAELAAAIEERLACAEVGRVGHVSVFYRPQPDPERRKIHLLGT